MKKALYIISILLVFCECILLAKEYTDTIENFRNMRALAKLIKVRDGDTFVITMATARRGERTLPMYDYCPPVVSAKR